MVPLLYFTSRLLGGFRLCLVLMIMWCFVFGGIFNKDFVSFNDMYFTPRWWKILHCRVLTLSEWFKYKFQYSSPSKFIILFFLWDIFHSNELGWNSVLVASAFLIWSLGTLTFLSKGVFWALCRIAILRPLMVKFICCSARRSIGYTDTHFQGGLCPHKTL